MVYKNCIVPIYTDEGSKQTIEIDTPHFVFPEKISRMFRTSNSLSTRKKVPMGKDILSLGSNLLVMSLFPF